MAAVSELPVRTLESDPEELRALVRDVVSKNARLWIVSHGSSMSPAIPAGSSVRLAPVGPQGPSRGDVVLAALAGGRLVLHRIVECTATSFVLRGDSRALSDPPVTRADILAVADRVSVNGREFGGRGRTRHRALQLLRGVARRAVSRFR